MKTNQKIYPFTDPEKAMAKIEQVNGPALDLTRLNGWVITYGCKISWLVGQGIITVTVEEKPIYVSYGEIFNQLGEVFAGAI